MEDDILFDDILSEAKADVNGRFELFGTQTEVTQLSPYLQVQHHCEMAESSLGRVSSE